MSAEFFSLPFAHAEIVVNAGKIVREKPPGIGGVVVNAHTFEFAENAGGIDFQGDLVAAKIRLVRKLAFPDARFPTNRPIENFDKEFAAILKCGATPLFIEYIAPCDCYLKEDGSPGGSPESNLIYMYRRYAAPPYNISKQSWQVGNESDINIDHYYTPQKYAEIFNRFHAALIKAGIRDNITLHGPVSAGGYYWPNAPKTKPLAALVIRA